MFLWKKKAPQSARKAKITQSIKDNLRKWCFCLPYKLANIQSLLLVYSLNLVLRGNTKGLRLVLQLLLECGRDQSLGTEVRPSINLLCGTVDFTTGKLSSLHPTDPIRQVLRKDGFLRCFKAPKRAFACHGGGLRYGDTQEDPWGLSGQPDSPSWQSSRFCGRWCVRHHQERPCSLNIEGTPWKIT